MQINASVLRNQIRQLMNATATIQRVKRVDLGGGKWREEPTTIATAAPCRIAPLSAREIDVGLRTYGEVTHAGVFDADQELAPQYLVTDNRGREFLVNWVMEPSIAAYKKAIMCQRQANP